MFKKTYTEPAIYVEDVVVENGIALSWGDAGNAGQGGDGYYDDSYDVDL